MIPLLGRDRPDLTSRCQIQGHCGISMDNVA
jgi:hypothetical protein